MDSIVQIKHRRLQGQLNHDVSLMKTLQQNLKADVEQYGVASDEAIHRAEELYAQVLTVTRTRNALRRVESALQWERRC